MTVEMLTASLEEEQRIWNWRDYMAQNIWAVGKMQLADPTKYPWPSWVELSSKPEVNTSDVTGEDIYNDLRHKWGGGD